jgi:hypothetical protein
MKTAGSSGSSEPRLARMLGLHLGVLLLLMLYPVMAWAADGLPDPAASLGPHWWIWPHLVAGGGGW